MNLIFIFHRKVYCYNLHFSRAENPNSYFSLVWLGL